MRFREKVKDARLAKGWTQGQLADEMTQRGVPAGWHVIAKIEAGSRGVQIGEAAVIADAFGITVDQLLGRRARPVADRDFILRELHRSTDDAARAVRVSVRDITRSADELAAIDHDGSFTDVITAVQDACTAGDEWERQLAQIGGQIAATRGSRAVWRAVRVKDTDNA
jgi:transcriptional regulator with XRE-family HTH domain